jgi:hypothetical protein
MGYKTSSTTVTISADNKNADINIALKDAIELKGLISSVRNQLLNKKSIGKSSTSGKI